VVKWIANFTELWLLSTAGTIIASILLSIGLAAVLHIIIEAPILNWGRKFSLMRRGQQTPDVSRQKGTARIPAAAE
jgi:exopolysaccharide production protein ExoZ